MPATEKTWRSQTLLHAIFAATGLALLFATLWMYAKDHDRPWKNYQKNARTIDVQMTEWRELQFQTEDFEAEKRRLEESLSEVLAAGLASEGIEQFRQEVNSDRARRGLDNASFAALDRAAEQLEATTQEAQEARQEYAELLIEFDRVQTRVEEARQAVAALEAEVPERAESQSALADLETELAEIGPKLAAAQQAKLAAEAAVVRPRSEVLRRMDVELRAARHREDRLSQQRKFKSADLDAKRATLGLAVRDSLPQSEQDQIQQDINVLVSELETLTSQVQTASQHRTTLQSIIAQLTEAENELVGMLHEHVADRDRLVETRAQRKASFFDNYGLPGKRWLELPILDAFNSPLKIDNLWSDGLDQDYNFSRVRRFDRCTTCHQSMTKTLPGSAVDQAFVHEEPIELTLRTRSVEDEYGEGGSGTTVEVNSIEQFFGLKFADSGLVNFSDVTVSFVAPYSLAAQARMNNPHSAKMESEDLRVALLKPAPLVDAAVAPGLMVGDVVEAVDGDRVTSAARLEFRLQEAARRGRSLTLRVRRGLPHPYVSHPRLDLFVGSMSPHDVSTFACTICHDGQGSATDFKWASHTPDSPRQRREWSKEHGWFDNHHWIYPMHSKRFLESSCLKCHHNVTELEPSERFAEPPAPKLMHGYELLVKYGCYGCHEVNGYGGDDRVGPDLRLEPNYFAAAQAWKNDAAFEQLDSEEKSWLEQLIHHPDRNDVRHQLAKLIQEDLITDEPRLTDYVHQELAPLFKDSESPGTLRKSGPSLRFVREKLDPEFLYDWIREPKHFRPSTRMPQFFGLWDHLSGESLEVAKKFEPIEILGTVHFLNERSQPFESLEPPEGITESTPEEKWERGRIAFQERGCLACHSHEQFVEMEDFRPDGEIVQGPDLSGLGDKFDANRNPKGRQWLYSWIKQPELYHVRTVMPDLYLDPVNELDGEGNVVAVRDPVDDIVEFLLSDSKSLSDSESDESEWTPAEGTLSELPDDRVAALDQLTLEHLRDAFFMQAAERYLKFGIPEDMADSLKGAEKELIVPKEQYDAQQPLTNEQKLLYVGRKSIAKYGCYACHDIPGFEDAKPIGTGLADWGRKEPEKLAFEHIAQYLEHGHGHSLDDHAGHQSGHHADEMPDFYQEQLDHGNRIGFIYQKLREPRSYDYHVTENKKYNERLRMPMFPFGVEEREAVITFVLGLVADPPNKKYIYQPTPRQKSILEGRQVIEKYNCGGCHIMEAEKWRIAYTPGEYGPQQSNPTFPFVMHHAASQELTAQATPDRSSRLTSLLEGLPIVSDVDGKPVVNDDIGEPLYEDEPYDPRDVEYAFQLYRPTVIDGHVYQTGEGALYVSAAKIENRQPTVGGDLTKYLLPHVVQREREISPSIKGSEGWGWLPPPLMGQGAKVQTDWMHDFLLDPYPIRPAVVLRMPRFNMSPAEATKLVNYFAAKDNVEYPYTFTERRRSDHLKAAEKSYATRLIEERGEETPPASARFRDAMQIVTNSNYCVQCHPVGDYDPDKELRGKGPDLARVYSRLRPDYLRRWLAKPTSILPYTGMPVNIAYDSSLPFAGSQVPQDLFHGDSIDQVDGLLDLLMNYDIYAKQRSLIAPLVQQQQQAHGEDAHGEDAASTQGVQATEEATEGEQPVAAETVPVELDADNGIPNTDDSSASSPEATNNSEPTEAESTVEQDN